MPTNQRLTQGRRLEKIRTKLEMSQTELGKYLKIPQSYISQMEKGIKSISNNIVTRLAQSFPQVNIGWLLTGVPDDDECAFIVHSTGNSRQDGGDLVQVIGINKPKNEEIDPLAISSTKKAPNAESFLILGNGTDFAMQTKSDSMAPLIEPYDWIVGQEVNGAMEIQEGKIYIIEVKSIGVIIKYLYRKDNGVLCVSENKEFHDPFLVPFKDVGAVWRVKACIKEHLWNTQIGLNHPAQVERIHHLEGFLTKQFPNFE